MATEFAEAEFITEDGKYIVGREVEKMSKSKYNVVNPDDICEDFGADTLRMYEMFLGPLEQAKALEHCRDHRSAHLSEEALEALS